MLLRDILNAVELLYHNTYFSFNDKFYKQIFGTPTGSPVSLILADIVMADLEEKCFKMLNYTLIFYFRYVDDILTCIPKEKINYTFKIFNSYNSNLKFTHELEINKCINFLKLTLINNNSKILYNWFRKNTTTNRF